MLRLTVTALLSVMLLWAGSTLAAPTVYANGGEVIANKFIGDTAWVATRDVREDGHCVYARIQLITPHWSGPVREVLRNCQENIRISNYFNANRVQLCQTGTWRCTGWFWIR